MNSAAMIEDPNEMTSSGGCLTSNKTIVIELKAKPAIQQEDRWGVWKSLIRAIFLKQPHNIDLQKLYHEVNELCLWNKGGSLYQLIERECEAHISAALQSLVGQSEDPVVFLSHVQKTWQDFCDQMWMICRIASGLDHGYVKSTTGVRSLWDMGLQLFVKHFSVSKVDHNTVSGLLKMIESDRSGEAVDRTLLTHLLKMLTDLSIYSDLFEKPFLSGTSQFYAAEGARLMQNLNVLEFLNHVEVRLREEDNRCLAYLDANTRKLSIATTERQLLVLHINAILDKGFKMLMDGNHTQDLQRMYTLFSRVGALESVRQALSSYIRKTGEGLVSDEDKDKDMVSSLLELKLSLDNIWESSFSKSDDFSETIEKAFKHLINRPKKRLAAELIAKFLDKKLRAGNKGTSEEELEGTLDKVLVLFRFVEGKDVFQAFYRKDLAKRLLLEKCESIDAEKSMILKLKTECGSQFTQKLEKMFMDIELSKEINESFRQSSQAMTNLPSGIELSVHVLNTEDWPNFPPMDARLPPELTDCQDIFKDFYLSKYGGRRLTWKNSLGHCVLRAEFPNGKKELGVSLFQTVVLMLFNDAQKLSLQDIRDATSIEDKELRTTLQSLACGKVRVLEKIPQGREVGDNDSFMVNDAFESPLFRIKVNAIQLKETVEENESTIKRVDKDYQLQIDAAIVRTMKTRKTLSHKLLITELIEKLKVTIELVFLKKRIESLIEREYMERDKNNPEIYNYLA